MALGHYDQAKGVPEDLYDQLRSSQTSFPALSVEIGERERELNEKTVQELYDSIEHTGLLSPIGIRNRPNGDGKVHKLLVYGYHRLEAWQRKLKEAHAANDEELIKRWNLIPVIWYPDEITDDMALLLEIKENLERRELTPGQRDTAMAKRAELMEKIRPQKAAKKRKGTKAPMVPFKPPAMSEYAGDKKGSADYRLLERRYAEHKKAHHGKAWNKQTKAEYEAFREWHKAAELREREEADRDAELAAEKTYEEDLSSWEKATVAFIDKHGPDALSDARRYLEDY